MKRRILIVDDEEGIRLIFLRALQHAGYEPMTADSASETLRLLNEEKFDLVLLDLSLPDAKELELLELILAQNPDLPVMILTGMPLEQSLVDEAMARGAKEFISKISSLDFTLQKVERFFKYGS
jgi:DNA-binding NtrC family response regulator